MTSTEIAVRQANGVAERDVVDGWITVAKDIAVLADRIADTEFVPKALRNKPAAIAACILTGRELGIGPMASLKSIHIVQGVPSLSAEYKRARALAAGHQIVIDESNGTRCVVRGRRANSEQWVTVTWTMDHARRAKLAAKEVWQQYPQRMLQARATSELCDLLFPDATLGLPTTEELEDGGALAFAIGTEVAAEAESNGHAEQKPPARTAQRRQRATPTAAATAAGAAPAAAPATAQTALAAPGLPLLPGEEDPSGPASDRTEAAGPEAPDEKDYDTPGTVTTPQLTAIWTVLRQVFEFTDEEKDQARAVAAYAISRALSSTREMSRNEAKVILDTLANWQATAKERGEEPRELLIAYMAAEAAAGTGDGSADGS